MTKRVIKNSQKPERKINLLIAVAGLNIGGAEIVIKHLVKTIDRSKFNVSVCCIKVSGVIGDELANEGVDVVTLAEDGENKVEYLTFLKLLKVIKQKKIDIIHTHTTDALADAAVCKLLRPNLKFIHTFHFGNYPFLNHRLMWMEKVFSRMANRLIAVGETQRQQLKAAYGFNDKRIGKIWNGVSANTRQDAGNFRRTIGVGDKVLVGTIAVLIEQKGIRDLLAVARQLQEYRDKVRFVVVGDGPLRLELESISKEYGLDDFVVFSGWISNAAEVALPAFDIFFQPSLWEAMSVVILEAMAAGKSIVATRVGENSKIIEDGKDGLLVNKQDIEGMVSVLKHLIEDSTMRCNLGEAAMKKVAQSFTVNHMTRRYEGIYIEELKGN